MWSQGMLGTVPVAPPLLHRMPGVYLAQVTGHVPAEHCVEVLLANLNAIRGAGSGQGVKAHVLSAHASGLVGEIQLPRLGDWGLIAFPGSVPELAVWLGSLYRDLTNICTEPPTTYLRHFEGGVWLRVQGNGTIELSHPSGTYIRLGDGEDLGARERHERHERQGTTHRRIPYTLPVSPAVTVHLHHSSGMTLTITPDGAVGVTTPSGVSIQADGEVSIKAEGQVAVEAGGDVSIKAAGQTEVQAQGAVSVTGSIVTVSGEAGVPDGAIIGGVGADYIALQASLVQIKAAFDTHVHPGVTGGPGSTSPPTPMPPFVPDVHYTLQTKAS